jgi:hypothetical protein
MEVLMGHTIQPDGSLLFDDDASNPVDDFQAGHDYAKRFAMFRDGTSTERTNLPPAQLRDGMEWYETDTKTRWQRIDGTWRQVRSTTTRTRTTAQNINNGSGTLDFNTATLVPDVPDFNYSAGVFTCQIPGVFLVTGLFSLQLAGASVGYTARIQKNGTNVSEGANVTSTLGSTCVPLLASVDLEAGDTVRVLWFANIAPAGVGMDVGLGKTYVTLTRVG